ncbi:MAG: PilX N-terminal domain-containing pilus assembly protein [candidate division NC10 bacterium]|nr:PilX N-terminal domain-containing pilus assembly protein [candidate division NC10 bacterium]
MHGQTIESMKDQRGVVLVVALLVLTVLSVLGLAFLTTARTEDTIAANYRNHTAAFYAAEAGVESGLQGLKTTLGANPNATDADLAKITPAALTDPNYTFSAFQVRRIRPTPYPTTLDSGPYAGLNALATAYEVTATVAGPRGSHARLTQRVNYVQVPLFQFAIFNGRGVDLEITPSPAAKITGRVHANSDLYLKEWTDLKFDGKMTSAGKILRYTKPEGPGDRANDPKIKDAGGVYQKLNFDHDSKVGFGGGWSEAEWAQKALDVFGGTVKDSAHGVNEIIPPIPSDFYDPTKPDVSAHQIIEKGVVGDSPEMKDAKIYYDADIRIENGIVKDKMGNTIDLDAKGCSNKTITSQEFYDPREQKDIKVTEIDIGKMKDCGVMPANGILWAHRDGSDRGIRLKNGSELPKQGLTIASENPIYIMGDYNTKNKVPAAIMGDAIYVLSNNWEKKNYDKKGNEDYTKRPAADTTVNAAVMLGPHAEAILNDDNSTNGYFENIFRLLEDWRQGAPYPTSSTNFTYSGSIVSLWHSMKAKAPFDNGTTYRTPPNRWWSYDTMFDTQLPPGTPMGIIYMRGQWSEG